MTEDIKRQKMSGDGEDSYFRAYSDISIHEEMIADKARTKTYRLAILKNYDKIRGKVVADIGAGTGILSMFCVQAGAKKVYAIEGSAMAEQAKMVIKANNAQEKVTVIRGKVEEVELPEKVDVIVSEWMGYFLLYESMLPSVLYARDKWLKEGGVLLPERADLFLAPINADEEYEGRRSFWSQIEEEYEVDMRTLIPYATKCHTDHVRNSCILPLDVYAHATTVCSLDLMTITTQQLQHIQKDFLFSCFGRTSIHGFAAWFDVTFPKKIVLSTSPYKISTHWEQSVLYLEEAVEVDQDTELKGSISIKPNKDNHRHLDIDVSFRAGRSEEQKRHYLMNDYIT